MTTTFLQVCVLAVLTATFGKTSGGKQCGIDQYINKNGKCRYCKFCRAGEGMNFTIEVPVNENGDPMGCHPCVPCPPATYNDPSAKQYACSQCRLDCKLMNRKEYEQCGGTKSGRCGACINSSYIDTENNIDSPCHRKNGVEIKGIKLFETNEKVVIENSGAKVDFFKSPTDGNTLEWRMYVIIGSLGIIAAAMVGLTFLIKKRKILRRSVGKAPSNSGEFLADSSASVGHDNIGVSHKYEKVSLDDVDVEIDGPTEDHTPHHELDNLNSSGPEALHSCRKPGRNNCVNHRNYPDIVVEERGVYFNHLAKHLYGHEVPEIFRQLEVRDQTIFGELKLHELDSIKYEDAIYRLLLTWVRLKTTNATLASLCPILEDNGLTKLSSELLDIAAKASDDVHTDEHDEDRLSIENTDLHDKDLISSQIEDTNIDMHPGCGQTESLKYCDTDSCTPEGKACDRNYRSLKDGSDGLDSSSILSLGSLLDSVAIVDIENVDRETTL